MNREAVVVSIDVRSFQMLDRAVQPLGDHGENLRLRGAQAALYP
jgi:hypothetical protein